MKTDWFGHAAKLALNESYDLPKGRADFPCSRQFVQQYGASECSVKFEHEFL